MGGVFNGFLMAINGGKKSINGDIMRYGYEAIWT